MVTTYPSKGKKKAAKICQVFADGAGGRCADPGCDSLYQGPAFFYGMTEHTLPLIDRCRREGRDWLYADNAYYWGRGRYYRVTRNRLMHDGAHGVCDLERGQRLARDLGVEVKPWRTGGCHIVITTQSELFYSFRLGMSRDEWLADVTARIADHSDRPIEVCHKPRPADMAPTDPHSRAFETMLADAWLLVTHSSSTALKALAEGVPVLWLGDPPDYGMCAHMGLREFAHIEQIGQPCESVDDAAAGMEAIGQPYDRELFFAALLSQQWTLEEMQNGRAWADLSRS